MTTGSEFSGSNGIFTVHRLIPLFILYDHSRHILKEKTIFKTSFALI